MAYPKCPVKDAAHDDGPLYWNPGRFPDPERAVKKNRAFTVPYACAACFAAAEVEAGSEVEMVEGKDPLKHLR